MVLRFFDLNNLFRDDTAIPNDIQQLTYPRKGSLRILVLAGIFLSLLTCVPAGAYWTNCWEDCVFQICGGDECGECCTWIEPTPTPTPTSSPTSSPTYSAWVGNCVADPNLCGSLITFTATPPECGDFTTGTMEWIEGQGNFWVDTPVYHPLCSTPTPSPTPSPTPTPTPAAPPTCEETCYASYQEYPLWECLNDCPVMTPTPTPTPTPAPVLPDLPCDGFLCPLLAQNITKLGGTLGPDGANSRHSEDPVNVATGNFVYQHQDLFITGRGLPLAITRSYNSLIPLSGSFGPGWFFNYNMKLAGINGSESVLVVREDGRMDIYNASTGGAYSPPTGIYDSLTRNADGTYILDRKDHITYHFTPTGQLMHIADTSGNTINLTYTGNYLTQVTDSSGRELAFTYDTAGRVVSVTDPIGRILSYTYDANDNLVRYTDPVGGIFDYTYDQNHRMTSITNPRGIRFVTNTYDGDGRVISQGNALGAVTNFSYDTTNRITTETDPLGRSTQYTHNAQFWELSEMDALGHTISYSYDGDGNRISATDANGHTSTYSYDASGNILQVTDPSGHSTSLTYDSENNLLSSTDALGRQATFSYDANSNPVQVTDASGNVTTFTYDQYGQVTHALDANGHGTTSTYNTYGNPVSVTDAAGNTATFTYDLVGRQVSATDARGKTSSFSYDALDRLLSVTDPLGHSASTSYDGNGNRISATDAMGSTTYYTYDSLNHLTQVTDPLGGTVSYTYDTATDLVSMTDANGHTTQYVYDQVHRLTAVTDPLGHTSNNSYDAAGNKISFTDNNGGTTYLAYDSLNRLTGISYHDQTSVSYTYDAVSNRLSMTDSSGTTGYTYDALNRLTSVTGSGGQTIHYGYDPVGNRIGMTYPDGKTVSYAYDNVNRLSGVTDWTGNTTSYNYDANSNLANMTYPNGMDTGYTYDDGNRLVNLVNRDGAGVVAGYAYTLDATGNRLQATETGPGNTSSVISYGYDVLNRLHTVTSSGTTVTYTYDSMGNRLNMATNAGNVSSSIAYTYDAGDQLLSAGNTTYTYDNNGNRIEKNESAGTTSYEFDAASRLVDVSVQGGPTLIFAYDGDGNRLSKAVASGNTTDYIQYVWDVNTGLPQLLTESDGESTALSLYGLQRISMTNSSGERMYYDYDGLGSVRSLSDTNGNTVSTYSYDAFGEPDVVTGSANNDFLYRAEQQDPETGLIFLRARYYDPSIGRFITRDSFPAAGTLTQGINRYVYTENNPVNRIDPQGKLAVADDLGFLGAGAVMGFVNVYFSDYQTNLAAGKTGMDLYRPSSSPVVYGVSIVGTAVTVDLAANVAELSAGAGLPVSLAMVATPTATFATAVTGFSGTNLAKDYVAGEPLDVKTATRRGSIMAAGRIPGPIGIVGKTLGVGSSIAGPDATDRFMDKYFSRRAQGENGAKK